MSFPITFATEGFGLNLNLFETNILNLALVIFGLYKFLPSFLGKMLDKRRETILSDLKDAEARLSDASISLAEAKKELSSAEQKAIKIRTDCKARAELIRSESEKRTVQEMARIKEGAVSDLNAEAARVSNQLRREVAQMAIKKALEALPSKLNKKTQDQFLKQSIQDMETN
tara:strand:- start:1086 stop:1601 length:516 start_codon:yes stop_codon:yes gene_type:complete